MAVEFIDLPINSMVILHSELLVITRGEIMSPIEVGLIVGITWECNGIYPLVNIQKTIENHHLVRRFSH